MNNHNLLFYGHSGSRNHGCEAIVRTTSELLSAHDITLYSIRPQEDHSYMLDRVCQIIDIQKIRTNRRSFSFLSAYLRFKLLGDHEPLNDVFSLNVLDSVTNARIALSIGGDNYCYSGVQRFMKQRAFLQKKGYKTVLWGCSVEPSIIDIKMRKDLSRYDLIVARETITYEALRSINPNTLLAPDPAFTLRCEPGLFSEGLGRRPYIGINLSPLIQKREAVDGITIDNYRELLTYILSETDRDIALIPHVVWDGNDDRVPLKQLFEEFKDSGRIYLVEDQNCMQLKDIISKCEFFIGARTHSTIAAYSTCVPTLVVGYSVKARGIARDLFGTEEGYVLPVQCLKTKDDLKDAFIPLYHQRDHLYDHLCATMPTYISQIQKAKEAVDAL